MEYHKLIFIMAGLCAISTYFITTKNAKESLLNFMFVLIIGYLAKIIHYLVYKQN